MLQAINLSKHFGARTLFDGISWQLQRGDRIGLVGPNGAGKSTLMRLLIGEETHDDGSVSCGRDETVAYLPQEAPRHNDGTALSRVLNAAATVRALEADIADVEKAMEAANADTVGDLAVRHGALLDQFAMLDGYTLDARAREILSGLGFTEKTMQSPLSSLSGGWWMRVELARLLLVRPDYLLLDEPTNHLDLESVAWLETFLASYPGAWVVVSHDRYFLNRMVDGIAELSSDGLFVFPGNYDDYVAARAELAERLAQEARTHAKRVEEISSFVERFRYKATKARQAQSRLKSLQRMEKPDDAARAPRQMRVKLPEPPRSGDIALTMISARKAYGSHVVYDDLSLQVRRGQRLALMGGNGAGKTTLLKMLAGVVPLDGGSCNLGHQALPYYFAQHQLEILDASKTIFEEMQGAMPLESITRIRSILGAFLFSHDAVDKRVGVLSGGEKSRLALAKMLAQPVNLLLLDEPTNHLDLASRDVLESALASYTGTVIFISHDRYFINRIATDIVEVQRGGKIRLFSGGYDYYLWKLQQETAELPVASLPTTEKSDSVQRREDKRSQERDVARRQKEASKLELSIGVQEKRIAEIDQLLCDQAIYNDLTQCKALLSERQSLVDGLPDLYARWETLAS